MKLGYITIESTDGYKYLVIADTHVGYEIELLSHGIKIPSQTDKIVNSIIENVERERTHGLIVLGDVKHELPTLQESYREVISFLQKLSERLEKIILVMGNHDGGLDKVLQKLNLKNVTLHDSRGFILETSNGKKILMLHGNSKPKIEDFERCDAMIMGHTHPAIVLQDSTGYIVKEPIIMKLTIDKKVLAKRMFGTESEGKELPIIVLPVSHPSTIGVNIMQIILRREVKTFTILQYVDFQSILHNVEIYLTDYTYLGSLNHVLEVLEK
ncbi:MAG: metallophosphoesterase [Thermoprotei archaeon ex4572_64]|nr:MAG: metallophosphoesterase [Thermoprotei archaeon ex4572_64]